MQRIKLRDRALPDYSHGEECMNMVTHIVGGGIGVLVLLACVLKGALSRDIWAVITGAVYGGTMVALYAVSSIYHGLRRGMGKKVMQVIDHCTIYFLIAGTYTPIVLCAVRPMYPELGWGLLVFEWALALLAGTLTAIDLKKYEVFSMICYIGMGWAVLPFAGVVIDTASRPGFLWILSGGIAYTVGAVLYGIGSKVKWMHSIFHIFVVLGSLLQAVGVIVYAL